MPAGVLLGAFFHAFDRGAGLTITRLHTMQIILPIILFCLLLAVLKTVILAGAIALGLTILTGMIFQPGATLGALSACLVMMLMAQQPALLAVFAFVLIIAKIIEVWGG